MKVTVVSAPALTVGAVTPVAGVRVTAVLTGVTGVPPLSVGFSSGFLSPLVVPLSVGFSSGFLSPLVVPLPLPLPLPLPRP